MAVVLINALASTAGGGITYLQNVLPRLASGGGPHSFIVFVPSGSIDQYRSLESGSLRFETGPPSGGVFARMIWEQRNLRNYITDNNVDLFIALGNFALFASPVPQILFNRNDLYFSTEFSRDLRSRKLFGEALNHWIKSMLARLSIRRADLNIAPTQAFAERIQLSFGIPARRFDVLPFGFDAMRFRRNSETSVVDHDFIRILYVSHYNYFRNFETLIRALPRIRDRVKSVAGREVRLVLTTDIQRGLVYGGYDSGFASDLIDDLGVRDSIDMLGPVAYDNLYQLYKSCDLFVCPSYSESFGHPLVEAMAAGLPIVSADLPVHREICRGAAVYFNVFDEEQLAEHCVDVLTDPALNRRLRSAATARSQDFSWDEHVKGLNRLIVRCLHDQSIRHDGSN